ncbi:heterokaryon incompatibility protein-domain-containing protein [Hypoxylon trugodes]|uniref:heterokaryon incompatibility protein-domain-containing protein n=1 Tax=Hypoxylon trugodes TaxID=326681 RepID=UPI00219C0BA1|nr:heterokaryon incompatibility protein-domain-containing protein [Hypoxylon trugodes]KAI1387288.1 heterokaryon incompatibility protein-domain-containing protein [Hypoxylon trugodes]
MSVYEPLQTKDTIRLLRVHRDANGSIVGELKPFFLDAPGKPQYKPISYVWGDDHQSQRTITLNGREYGTLRTVYSILELFCDRPEFKKSQPWIWIDFICINQEDLAERAMQVALMVRIYGESYGATIWLGEGTSFSDRGMDMMKAISEGDSDEEKKKDPKMQDVDAWKDYEQVALNPWFRRGWTLQESITGYDDTSVYFFGNKMLTRWEVICAAHVTRYRLPDGIPVDIDNWLPLWNRRRIYHWYRFQGPGRWVSLLALMAYNCQTVVSDDRDHIYSLLGVINQKDRETVGLPRYDLDVETVYTKLVKDWVRSHQSLDIISFAHMCHRRHGKFDSTLPSWVPDWRNRDVKSATHIPVLVSQSGKQHIGNFRPWAEYDTRGALKYDASGDKKPAVEFSEDGRRLVCKGILIDVLDGIAGMVDESQPASDQTSEPLTQSTSPVNSLDVSNLEVSSANTPTDPKKEDVPTTVGRQVVSSLAHGRGDEFLKRPVPWRRFLSDFKAIAQSDGYGKTDQGTKDFIAWYKINKTLRIRGLTLGDICKNAQPGDEKALNQEKSREPQGNNSFIERFTHSTSTDDLCRRLFVTEQGHLGTAPQRAQKGDKVCVLFGCSVASILRPDPVAADSYEYIGEAYLDGFMEGQALKMGKPESTFVLV